MIPYLRLDVFYIGPIPVHVWGLMVASGILAAILFSACRAKAWGVDGDRIWDMSFGTVVCAFIMARLVHVVGYGLDYYTANPSEIIKIWHGGLSATGGLIGAIAYMAWYIRRHKLDFWAYGDVIAYGFPLGYAIGRLGCFLVHDHPGTLSHFILAVKYPGGARHDLGLDLSISAALAFIIFLIVHRFAPIKGWPKKFFASLFFLWYGLSRLLLDFLRAYDLPGSDQRYWGLTPAQYFGIILIIIGSYNLVTIFYVRKSDN